MTRDKGHANMPTNQPPDEPDNTDESARIAAVREKRAEMAHDFTFAELEKCSEADLRHAVNALASDLNSLRHVRYTLIGQVMFYRDLIDRETGEPRSTKENNGDG